MDRYAVIGFPSSHSLSPLIHNAGFQAKGMGATYEALDVPDEGLSEAIVMLRKGFRGFNVTHPLKGKVLPYLDDISPEARAIGAVNTVVIQNDLLRGDNTDARGFMEPLTAWPRRALILGTGGAARAVVWGLRSRGVSVAVTGRRSEVLAAFAAEMGGEAVAWERRHRALEGVDLLVNATPVGQWPQEEASPMDDLSRLTEGALVYDLVYRPRKTALLRQAEALGLQAQSGLAMLAAQAALSWGIWFGEDGPGDLFLKVLEDRKDAP